jgi:hypothetical protein
MRLHSKGRLLASWTLTNTLAYYATFINYARKRIYSIGYRNIGTNFSVLPSSRKKGEVGFVRLPILSDLTYPNSSPS